MSFFGLVIVGVAFAIARLWNGLRRDFERSARLSFRGALAGVALTLGAIGLLSYLIHRERVDVRAAEASVAALQAA